MPAKRAGPGEGSGAPSPKRRALEARDPTVEVVRASIREGFEAYKQLVLSAEGDLAEVAYQKLCDLSQGKATHSILPAGVLKPSTRNHPLLWHCTGPADVSSYC